MTIAMVRDVSDFYDLIKNKDKERDDNKRANIIHNDIDFVFKQQLSVLDELPAIIDGLN